MSIFSYIPELRDYLVCRYCGPQAGGRIEP